ncbi:MAG: gluconate 2-dehydrogenase subunit 3 family protein, partial [Chloroflexia bacterium]|nr:gluconate 2-dehydrogenase subunit 3 family protein [Chloroflexia bacterium]
MPDEAGLALNAEQARTAAAIFERMFPADDVPGATEIGVVRYLDRALAGAYREDAALYRRGLAQLDAASRSTHGVPFEAASPAAQDALLHALERGEIAGWPAPEQAAFFRRLRAHLQEGLFSDPAYGGNIDKAGWRALGHPGVWLDNSAEENLSPLPVDKGGRIQSLADVQAALAA